MIEVAIFAAGVLAGTGVILVSRKASAPSARASRSAPSESTVMHEEAVDRSWHPPYVSGEPLRAWARSVSRGTIRNAIAEGDENGAATRIAAGLSAVTRQAMLPDASPRDRSRLLPCPTLGQGTVGVTAPEAIALAEWLRTRLDADELQELVEDVTLCDEWIANGATAVPCALQGDAQVCMAHHAEPLTCRPTLAATLVRQLREEGGIPEAVRAFADVHARTVGDGLAEGLTEGLEQAGLDATVYELHSALRRALARSDAAETWARGGTPFEGCRRIASPADRPLAVPLGLPPRPVVRRPTRTVEPLSRRG